MQPPEQPAPGPGGDGSAKPPPPPPAPGRRRLGPAQVGALAVMLAACAVMGYLSYDAWRARPQPPAGFDPMRFEPTAVPPAVPRDATIDAWIGGGGEALDHEPAKLDPYPGAELLDRFARRSRTTREAVSVHRLPPGTALEQAAEHYRAAAGRRGFDVLTIDRGAAADGTARRGWVLEDEDGRVLTIRLAPAAAGGAIHATAWLRYAIKPDPTANPPRSVSP